MTRVRSYSELRRLDTLEERFAYLAIGGVVGKETFGNERHWNQRFYTSSQWKQVRNHVIARDNGCDLGIDGWDIYSHGIIHHMNPMTLADIQNGESWILDPEFLVLTTLRTHNAIHFGDERQLPRLLVERTPGDTKVW